MELPDVITALLYVADNSSPFNGTHALYKNVLFKRGYPLGDMKTPTVALYVSGGNNVATGLGTVRQWRTPTISVDVLAENDLEAERIAEKLRDVWQADFDCDGTGTVGTVTNGYIRETGGVKNIEFSEPRIAPWDDAGRVNRRTFEITVKFKD
jgi:hypothetical protein